MAEGDEGSSGDPTEAPSQRRLDQAQREGQAPVSREAIGFATLLAGTLAGFLALPPLGLAWLRRHARPAGSAGRRRRHGAGPPPLLRQTALALLPFLAPGRHRRRPRQHRADRPAAARRGPGAAAAAHQPRRRAEAAARPGRAGRAAAHPGEARPGRRRALACGGPAGAAGGAARTRRDRCCGRPATARCACWSPRSSPSAASPCWTCSGSAGATCRRCG